MRIGPNRNGGLAGCVYRKGFKRYGVEWRAGLPAERAGPAGPEGRGWPDRLRSSCRIPCFQVWESQSVRALPSALLSALLLLLLLLLALAPVLAVGIGVGVAVGVGVARRCRCRCFDIADAVNRKGGEDRSRDIYDLRRRRRQRCCRRGRGAWGWGSSSVRPSEWL